MVNENGIRQLAYVVEISDTKPIDGYDKIELVTVLGWTVVCQKGLFNIGDKAIYIEYDSKVPAEAPFEFMAARKYRVKAMKMCKGTVVSFGLLMQFSDFPSKFHLKNDKWYCGKSEIQVGDDMTEILGITYWEPQDTARKAIVKDKYERMADRHHVFFKHHKWARNMMDNKVGREILMFIFGQVADKKSGAKAFPKQFPYVKKTDEDRIENMPWRLKDKDTKWIKTLKIDGTSATYILERKPLGRYEFYVCSRNVRMLTPAQECFHGENVYWEMAEKYHIYDALKSILQAFGKKTKYIALQGEIAGPDIQGNPHKLPERRFYGFNFIDSNSGRWETPLAAALMSIYDIQWVPYVGSIKFVLPDTMEKMKASADGLVSEYLPEGSGLREGFVYRAVGDPSQSFKNVSTKYLLSH